MLISLSWGVKAEGNVPKFPIGENVRFRAIRRAGGVETLRTIKHVLTGKKVLLY